VNPISSRYPTRTLRSYVRAKIATDPAYDAVFDLVRDSSEPLLDIGCGVGLLAFYLRSRGVGVPIVGIDHDRRKIDLARAAVNGERDLSFEVADAREHIPFHGNVVLLDVLHYFSDDDQMRILRNAAGTGGMVIIRDAIRDGSLRYRATYIEEAIARAGGWLKADRLNFPTRERIEEAVGSRAEVRPMFGRMPFNNYLFVFRRSSGGITNA
jgi:SAM-dependent methyltransferase